MKEAFEKIPETEIEKQNKVTNLFDEMERKLEEMKKEAEKEIGPEGQPGYVSKEDIDDLLRRYFHEFVVEDLVSPIELATGNKYGRDKILISPDNRGLLEKRVTRFEEGATTTYKLLNSEQTKQLLERSSEKFSQKIKEMEEKKRKCDIMLEKFKES